MTHWSFRSPSFPGSVPSSAPAPFAVGTFALVYQLKHFLTVPISSLPAGVRNLWETDQMLRKQSQSVCCFRHSRLTHRVGTRDNSREELFWLSRGPQTRIWGGGRRIAVIALDFLRLWLMASLPDLYSAWQGRVQ